MKQRIYDFFIKDDGVWDAIMFKGIEKIDPEGSGMLTDFYYWVEDRGKDIYCLIKGHDYHPDQCGIPEHDYCAWCLKAIPDNLLRKA